MPAQTYPVDHQTIRTELARSGFTPTQLIQLFRAANVPPPTRLNKQNRTVVETTKYLLAERLCSAAGSATQDVREGQLFDYHTLNSWMAATRHRQNMESWQPPVHPSCLTASAGQPCPKRARGPPSQQPSRTRPLCWTCSGQLRRQQLR